MGRLGCALFAVLLSVACGDDDGGSEAIRSGVGDACATTDECVHDDQECLTEFKGGYCGRRDCVDDADCPQGSACVMQGASSYCFLVCLDKADCNVRRGVDEESNCSSSVDFVDDSLSRKACVPPSGT